MLMQPIGLLATMPMGVRQCWSRPPLLSPPQKNRGAGTRCWAQHVQARCRIAPRAPRDHHAQMARPKDTLAAVDGEMPSVAVVLSKTTRQKAQVGGFEPRSQIFPKSKLAARLQGLRLSGRDPADPRGRLPMSCLADMIGVSRQTVNEAARGVMGDVTQIRLSHVLRRIDAGELGFVRRGQRWEVVQDPPRRSDGLAREMYRAAIDFGRCRGPKLRFVRPVQGMPQPADVFKNR